MKKMESAAADLWEKVQKQVEFKQNEWDPVFQLCDKYYQGYKHNRKWRLSKKPRSNLRLHVTSDLVETVYSQLLYQLFYSGGEEFFDIVGDNVQGARDLTKRVRFNLYAPVDSSGRSSFLALKKALRFNLRYSLGIVGLAKSRQLNRPTLYAPNPYDIFWDPVGSEWIDDSPLVTRRMIMSIKDLSDLRAAKGYNIPADKYLKAARHDSADFGSQGDQSKSEDSLRSLGTDVTGYTNFRLSENELVVYRTSTIDRFNWIAEIDGYPCILFDAPNTNGFQPYTATSFRPLLWALGGLSIPYLNAGEHDLEQLMTNSGIDLVNLATEPPRTKGPGNQDTKTWDPGALIDTDEKIRDKVMETRFPPEIFAMYSESRMRSLRTAGVSEMSLAGMPQPSNANRTLGGMQLQSAAKSERQFGTVSNIEDMLVVPTLTKMILMDQSMMGGRAVQGMGEGNQREPIDPANMKAVEDFSVLVRGATRMVGVERLAGFIQPVLQYAMDPMIQAEAAKSGNVLDFNEVIDFFSEATGTARKFKFYRPMTQQEAQIRQQADLGPKQLDNQARAQSDQTKAQAQLMLEQLRQQGLAEQQALEVLKVVMDMLKGGGKGSDPSQPGKAEG